MGRWIAKAEIAFANDLITASLALDPDSGTRAAFQLIADSLISGAIAADPTLAANVTQAAVSAVGAELAGRSIPTGARQVTPRNQKAAIWGAAGRVLAAFRRSDGMLDDDTARAFGRRIAEVGSTGITRRIGSSRHPWSHVWTQAGRIVLYIDKRSGQLMYGDGTPVASAGSTAFTFRADGDSTTMGADLANMVAERWTTLLGLLLGITIANYGISGNRAADAGTMAGTYLATASVSGGTIPAQGGTVALTTSTSPFYGTLNNVPTGITADLYLDNGTRIGGGIVGTSSTGLTFTRASAGGAVNAATVKMQVTNGKSARDGVRIFSIGINDEPDIVFGNTTIEQVKNRYREFVTANRGELWTWGLLNRGLNEGAGSNYSGYPNAKNTILAYLAEMDTFLTSLFGVRYIPVARYLGSQQALTDAAAIQPGFTPTQADLDTVAAGLVPPSFRSSAGSVHLNALGHILQARFMATWMRQYSIHSERFAA
ncbi:hypothetical protein [Microbacterium testaceum]|uniref:Uncharacterized protein n=1 Tax=Microbacterium testaceum TaxID=2033 RepID=A0A147F4U9_MICTE|nr:hypothetical protein [Microbacterium testaceum]KTS09027.1 hypothetical protein RSA3_14075 [Microbacterium testaceum]